MRLQSNKFTWIKESKTLFAEASSLQFKVGSPFPQRLFVTSKRTGKTEAFERSENVVDDCGQVYLTKYRPMNVNLTCKIEIAND